MYEVPEHQREITPEVKAERVALAANRVTLDGKDAVILGTDKPFAYVMQMRSGLMAEYSWEAVKRVVAGTKAFTA